MVVAKARSDGGKISASVPAPIASAGEKNTPAKNLNITKPANVGAKPAPSVKRAARGGEMR